MIWKPVPIFAEASTTTVNSSRTFRSLFVLLGQPIDGIYVKAQTCGRLLALEFIFRPRQGGEPCKQAFGGLRNWATIQTPGGVFELPWQLPFGNRVPKNEAHA